MWQDPIVAETRTLREHYASRFDHDGGAIFEDILRRQAVSGRQVVTFSARKPIQASFDPQQQTAQAGWGPNKAAGWGEDQTASIVQTFA
ncbi:MAG TPA: hypothetical protein VK141_08335 [Nitrosomonas sp.]|nr:hypothetical protein [Nitrosomonas sp.]